MPNVDYSFCFYRYKIYTVIISVLLQSCNSPVLPPIIAVAWGRYILFKFSQPQKAVVLRLFKDFGRLTSCKEVQYANAKPPISEIPSGRSMPQRLVQAKNARACICFISLGKVIFFKFTHLAKASGHIIFMLFGKVMLSRSSLPSKAPFLTEYTSFTDIMFWLISFDISDILNISHPNNSIITITVSIFYTTNYTMSSVITLRVS